MEDDGCCILAMDSFLLSSPRMTFATDSGCCLSQARHDACQINSVNECSGSPTLITIRSLHRHLARKEGVV